MTLGDHTTIRFVLLLAVYESFVSADEEANPCPVHLTPGFSFF